MIRGRCKFAQGLFLQGQLLFGGLPRTVGSSFPAVCFASLLYCAPYPQLFPWTQAFHFGFPLHPQGLDQSLTHTAGSCSAVTVSRGINKCRVPHY